MDASWADGVSGHCELDSDFVSRIILRGAYLLYYLRYDSQTWCVVASLDGRVLCTSFGVTVTLTSFLEQSCQEQYLLYYLR